MRRLFDCSRKFACWSKLNLLVIYGSIIVKKGRKRCVSLQQKVKEKREKIMEQIKQFRLFDDNFMTKCFEDNIECTELVLQIIMEKSDLKVIEARTQYTIKNLQGRSIRLDVDAVDSKGKKYNIEVQRADKGAGEKRARYNSSLIDANVLLAGDDTKNLPETYVIFITENDVMEKNQPMYHIDRYIRETGEYFKDGSHIIYVNGSYQDDSPLGLLMKDFACKNPKDMHYKILADRVRYFKENEKGVSAMCKAVEELVKQELLDIAKDMLEDGILSLEKIAEYSKLTLEEVKELAQQN